MARASIEGHAVDLVLPTEAMSSALLALAS
jgi:hypothetical protein